MKIEKDNQCLNNKSYWSVATLTDQSLMNIGAFPGFSFLFHCLSW